MDMTNQEYSRYVERKAKPSPIWKNLTWAFCTGGLICTGGQALLNLYQSCGLSEGDASCAVSVTIIFLAALCREQRLAQARATGDDSLAATLQAAGRDYMTHAPAWYRFNRRVLRYSAAADRWTTVDRADQAARAGAALTGKGTTFYYLGGELKPGIRTPDLWQGQYR